MTRKEAINLLEMIEFKQAQCNLGTWYFDIDKDMEDALTMAIKALEQETCEDAISRQEVHRQINKWVASGESDHLLSLHNRVDTLPSVKPAEKVGIG